MVGSEHREGVREKKGLVELSDVVLHKLFSEFDQETGSQLLIFDGTSNQKLVILAWMIDVLKRDIEKLAIMRKNDVIEQSAIILIRNNLHDLIPKVLEQASAITGSSSLLSEDDRKLYIERYAGIIDMYCKDVEDCLRNPSAMLANSQLLKESNRVEVPPLSKGALLDISTFLQNFHLENNAFFETAESGERKTPGFFDGNKVPVPMTPIRGVTNSEYVSLKQKGINIHKRAYADTNTQHAYVPYDIHINDTFEEILHGMPKNLTYVGAKYPDGSSLSYLPIKNITVLRRPSDVQLPSRLEGGFVELRIPRMAYEKIKTICASAFLKKNPHHSIRYPLEVETDDESIVIDALARGYRRLRIINSERVYHVTLLQAIESCSHDLTGDGLLHVRFDKHTREEKKATMKIIFFGLQIVRTASNHFQKIFRM